MKLRFDDKKDLPHKNEHSTQKTSTTHKKRAYHTKKCFVFCMYFDVSRCINKFTLITYTMTINLFKSSNLKFESKLNWTFLYNKKFQNHYNFKSFCASQSATKIKNQMYNLQFQ